MEQEDYENWEQFEKRIRELQDMRAALAEESDLGVSHLLFRGQGDAAWNLETTLDRTGKGPWSFSKYFELIAIAQPQIETFTNRRWEIEEVKELNEWSSKYENLWGKFPAYDYLVFLRHYGFPSPLLDWTRSPYVAAFFAFSKPHSDRVAVYVYLEYLGLGKESRSDKPRIVSFGPNVRSHPRHFLQQSEYTIAAQFQGGELWYAPHEKVFAASSTGQDLLLKLTMPKSERRKVLEVLDAHNLNAFSLFQTEEALLNTIAVRELELR